MFIKHWLNYVSTEAENGVFGKKAKYFTHQTILCLHTRKVALHRTLNGMRVHAYNR